MVRRINNNTNTKYLRIEWLVDVDTDVCRAQLLGLVFAIRWCLQLDRSSSHFLVENSQESPKNQQLTKAKPAQLGPGQLSSSSADRWFGACKNYRISWRLFS